MFDRKTAQRKINEWGHFETRETRKDLVASIEAMAEGRSITWKYGPARKRKKWIRAGYMPEPGYVLADIRVESLLYIEVVSLDGKIVFRKKDFRRIPA